MKRLLAVVTLALATVGCAESLLATHGAPPQVYRLTVVPSPAGGGDALPVALSVARPRAPASLDTDRVAVRQAGNGFDYFAGVRWSDPAPQMLQQMLVEGLVADGRFATAVAAPSRVPTEYLIDVELREFAACYAAADAAPEVRVQWQVTLVDSRSGARITSFVVAAAVTAAANRRDAVVAAFEQATRTAVDDTVARIRASSAGLAR